MGLDIDDRKRETQSFHVSEKPVTEGLAQHFTMLATKRMAGQVPNALQAYLTLLKCQPKAYQVQIPWEKAFSSEQMRSALIGTRRSDSGVSLSAFEEALKRSKEHLQCLKQLRKPRKFMKQKVDLSKTPTVISSLALRQRCALIEIKGHIYVF